MNHTTTAVRTKLLALIGVAFLLLAAGILLVVPPAAGYEISIYEAFPWYFWALVVGAILVGHLVILRSAVAEDPREIDVSIGVLLALVPVLTLTLLPYIRGYPVYGRADVLTHLGIVRDLPERGIAGNVYPPIHLTIESLAAATGQEPMSVINLLPVVFSVVFFGSMYLLVDQLFEDRRTALFALPFVLFPVMGSAHVTAVPYVLSVLLGPFVLFLLVKEQSTNAVPIRAMVPIALVGVVLYHPLTALFVAITFVLYVALKRLPRLDPRFSGPTTVASLALVVFGSWYLTMPGIVNRFRSVFSSLLYPEAGDSDLETTLATIERTSPDLLDVGRIAALQYGDDVLLFGLATAFVGVGLLAWWRNEKRPDVFELLFGCTVILFAVAAVGFLLFDFIGGFGRPLAYGRIFAVVLAGALAYWVWRSSSTPAAGTAFAVGLSLLLVTLVVLSVFGMFPSPLVAESNHQVTEMELDGMEWTFESRNDERLVDEFGINQYRFSHLRHGTEATVPAIRRHETRPPDHFNYTDHETLGASYGDDRYLLVTQHGRILFPERFPDYEDQWRYTHDDFERLEHDRTVARLYDNGEFDVYRIDSEPTSAAS